MSSTSTFAGCAPSSAATPSRPFGVRVTGLTRPDRWTWPARGLLWVDVVWAIFAIINVLGMLVFATWETVPFHFIWVSLTILYGFRVWRMRPTLSVLGAIIVATTAVLIVDVMRGTQPLDEVTEVPLMSAMFLAWSGMRVAGWP